MENSDCHINSSCGLSVFELTRFRSHRMFFFRQANKRKQGPRHGCDDKLQVGSLRDSARDWSTCLQMQAAWLALLRAVPAPPVGDAPPAPPPTLLQMPQRRVLAMGGLEASVGTKFPVIVAPRVAGRQGMRLVGNLGHDAVHRTPVVLMHIGIMAVLCFVPSMIDCLALTSSKQVCVCPC